MAVFRIDRFAPSRAAADAARDRLSALLKRTAAARRRPSADLVRLVDASLILAIGALIVWTFWLGLGPFDPPPEPPPRAAAAAESLGPVDPFRTAEVAEAAPADPGESYAETTLDLKLHGTWIDEDGGVAFIGTPNGEQKRYAPGDAITGGVTLGAVYRDRVVISRNGVRESLSLINRENAPAGSGGDFAAPAPAQGDTDLGGLATIGGLVLATAQTDEVGATQLILQPTHDAAAFKALGLVPGDKLVAIDNEAVGADIGEALETIAMVEGQPSVTLSIERDGVVMPVTVELPEASADRNEE